jgi:hypothetical protein
LEHTKGLNLTDYSLNISGNMFRSTILKNVKVKYIELSELFFTVVDPPPILEIEIKINDQKSIHNIVERNYKESNKYLYRFVNNVFLENIDVKQENKLSIKINNTNQTEIKKDLHIIKRILPFYSENRYFLNVHFKTDVCNLKKKDIIRLKGVLIHDKINLHSKYYTKENIIYIQSWLNDNTHIIHNVSINDNECVISIPLFDKPFIRKQSDEQWVLYNEFEKISSGNYGIIYSQKHDNILYIEYNY